RRAFHHEMFAIEEVGRVLGIRGHRTEARERRERRAGPLPAVAHEIVDSPSRLSRRMAAGRFGIPTLEIKDAARGTRSCLTPRKRTLHRARRAVGRALKFSLSRKTNAAPTRVREGFGVADVDRPRQRERYELEHRAPEPRPVALLPERRLRDG